MRSTALLIAVIFAPLFAIAGASSTVDQATSQPDPQHRDWHAAWVTHPTAPLREPLVLHFRRVLQLASVPASYVVRVSADNRFVLFVNGSRVGDGPARGDLTHWRYERFDVAPYLKAGHNLITATVWNFGVYAPIAQFSDRTAFLLESEATDATGISTPKDWQVEEEPGMHPLGRDKVTLKTYFASGPGEELDASTYDWDWNSGAQTKNWLPVGTPMRDSIFPVNGAHSADETGDNPWGLVPNELPHMEYVLSEAGTLARGFEAKDDSLSVGAEASPGKAPSFFVGAPNPQSFPFSALTIPRGNHIHLLLDHKTLTTAYPQLIVTGGKGSHIVLTYSEALYDKEGHKGDRDEVADRTARGLTDSFLPDGGEHRVFMPLWWRTWRYLDLDITTSSEPLTLESLKAYFTAYPFQERAKFDSDQPDLDKIWEISWRTARLDAHETYMDTPYYEQLQYVGDTRIQALISYSVGGDDRLGRQAITAFDQSRIPEGITRSRYPSSLPQNIPTFSLIWVGMLHDYWMYRPDPQIVRDSLPGTRAVLTWFAKYEHTDGLLGELPWWSFIDWVVKGEIPSYDSNHESCMTSLEYLGALMDAADLEKNLGDPVLAKRYDARLNHVRSGIASMCWVPSRGLLAENPDQKVFSQQANILGVLYDVIPKDRQQDVLRRLMDIKPGTTPGGVMSASYYFRFYLSRALDHAGMEDEYLKSLDPWRELLPLHFSTWPEQPGETRSDSHAWSAHPIYDLLSLVAGIEPASEGFASVRVAPHLGQLDHLSATFPHPQGDIKVQYQRRGSALDATVTLPGILTGTFRYEGKDWELKPGSNHIEVR
jgi:alpha-L-rhamnosidase